MVYAGWFFLDVGGKKVFMSNGQLPSNCQLSLRGLSYPVKMNQMNFTIHLRFTQTSPPQ